MKTSSWYLNCMGSDLNPEARRRVLVASIIFAAGLISAPLVAGLTWGWKWSLMAGAGTLAAAIFIGTIFAARSLALPSWPVIVSAAILALAVMISALLAKEPSDWLRSMSVWAGTVGGFFVIVTARQRGRSAWTLIAGSLALAVATIIAVSIMAAAF